MVHWACRMSSLHLGAALLVCASGCGLISSDATTYDLDLPAKSFSVDANGWMVDADHAHTLLQTSCAAAPAVCGAAAMQACGKDCTGTCDASTHTCDLSLGVSLYQAVDLVAEVPALAQIDVSSVLSVTIDDVAYEVTANTLDIATPPLTIYVAPSSVMSPSDPAAKPIGTVASVPSMTKTTSAQTVVFVDGGKAALSAAMSSYKTPFNILVGATVTVTAEDQVPTGRLDAVVHIKAHAGL